jgi:predicted component of type VI protein secretion system
MKVSLQITSGPRQGEVIPVTVSPFLIGRDAACHLRPATSVVSKKHCGIILRDGKVFVADYGSTNGTLVGDLVLRKSETEVEDGVAVMVARYGPLEFTVQIAAGVEGNNGGAASAPRFKVDPGEASPTPARGPTQPVQHPAARLVPPPAAPPVPQPAPRPAPVSASDDDSESIAALLLRSDPGAADDLPECGTMKIIGAPPSEDGSNADDENKAAEILHNAKPDPNAKKGNPTPEEMSNAANELLSKLRRAAKPPPGCRFLSSPPES